ncbi:hypothetical protein NX059_011911 [Plenodomus lindquistii]|nr:hypothetical protein NX059_011911 [Plenodomus lindquistii]
MSTHYDTLVLPRGASEDEIKKAYRALQLQHHPDKTKHLDDVERKKSETISKQLNVAYEVLSDPVARRKYDATLPPLFPLPAYSPNNTQPFRRTPAHAQSSHGPPSSRPKAAGGATPDPNFMPFQDAPPRKKRKSSFSVFEDTPPRSQSQSQKPRGFTPFQDDSPTPGSPRKRANQTPPASPRTPLSPLSSNSSFSRTPLGSRTPNGSQVPPRTSRTPSTPLAATARSDPLRRRIFSNVSVVSGEGLGWKYTIVLNGKYAILDHPKSTITTVGPDSITIKMNLQDLQKPKPNMDVHVTISQPKGSRRLSKMQSLFVVRQRESGSKEKTLEVTLAICPLYLAMSNPMVLDKDETFKFGWDVTLAGVDEAPKDALSHGTCMTLHHNEAAAKAFKDSPRGPLYGQRPATVLERDLMKEVTEKHASNAVMHDVVSEQEYSLESEDATMFTRASVSYVGVTGGQL